MAARFSTAFAVGAVGLAALIVACLHVVKESRYAKCRSFLSCLNARILQTPEVVTSALPSEESLVGSEWILLQSDRVTKLVSQCSIDLDICEHLNDGTPVDPWGHPYQIAVRRVDGGWDCAVFSGGPDGMPCTADDVDEPNSRVPARQKMEKAVR